MAPMSTRVTKGRGTMHSLRCELRIFGLLVFCLMSCILLGFGIESGLENAELVGKIGPFKISVIGAAALLPILILILHWTKLFSFGLESKGVPELGRPIEKLTADDIDEILDKVETNLKQNERLKQKLLQAKDALKSGGSEDDVRIAFGIRVAQRPRTGQGRLKYYVCKIAQANGDHEVHRQGCSYLPNNYNIEYLGEFTDCSSAMVEAKKFYAQANGCYYCSQECHTT